MADAQPQQLPTIVWLLQSGGVVLLALGLVLALIGIVLVIWPIRTASRVLAFLSLLPGIFGLVVVYYAAADYAEMAVSPAPPKPAEFARVTGRAMGSSFCGLLATIVPAFLAILAMSRAHNSVHALDIESNRGSVPQ